MVFPVGLGMVHILLYVNFWLLIQKILMIILIHLHTVPIFLRSVPIFLHSVQIFLHTVQIILHSVQIFLHRVQIIGDNDPIDRQNDLKLRMLHPKSQVNPSSFTYGLGVGVGAVLLSPSGTVLLPPPSKN